MRCAAPARLTRKSPRPAAASPRPSRATAAASDDELLDQSRRRLHALMAGGCTTIEIKSGYGLDTPSELRLLKIAKALGKAKRCASCRPCSRSTRLPAEQRDRRAHYVGEIVDKLIPAAAKAGPRDQRRRLLRHHRLHARRGRAAVQGRGASWPCASGSTPSNSRTSTAPRSPPNIAPCRPTISNISTKPAPRRWRRRAPSRCCCPAPSMRCRRSESRRSHCCASTRCRSRSRPTAIPAPRLCCRRRWR